MLLYVISEYRELLHSSDASFAGFRIIGGSAARPLLIADIKLSLTYWLTYIAVEIYGVLVYAAIYFSLFLISYYEYNMFTPYCVTTESNIQQQLLSNSFSNNISQWNQLNSYRVTIFSVRPVPRCYKQDIVSDSQTAVTRVEAVSDTSFSNPASRRRRRKGMPRIWDSKIGSQVPRYLDPRMTAPVRASSNCKRQSHPLVRESDPHQQTHNRLTVIKFWS
jgi:hypothetical protein